MVSHRRCHRIASGSSTGVFTWLSCQSSVLLSHRLFLCQHRFDLYRNMLAPVGMADVVRKLLVFLRVYNQPVHHLYHFVQLPLLLHPIHPQVRDFTDKIASREVLVFRQRVRYCLGGPVYEPRIGCNFLELLPVLVL